MPEQIIPTISFVIQYFGSRLTHLVSYLPCALHKFRTLTRAHLVVRSLITECKTLLCMHVIEMNHLPLLRLPLEIIVFLEIRMRNGDGTLSVLNKFFNRVRTH
jgi:hypothetical protein